MDTLKNSKENQFYIFSVQDKSTPHHIESWTTFLADESVVEHFKNTNELYLLEMYNNQIEQPDAPQMIHTSISAIPFMTAVEPIHREKDIFDVIYVKKGEFAYRYVKGLIEIDGNYVDTQVWLYEGKYEIEFYHNDKPYIENKLLDMKKITSQFKGRI